MIDDLLYKWENSSGRRRVELQQKIIEWYETGSFRQRMYIRSKIREHCEYSGEGLIFHEVLVGIEMILKDKGTERKKHPLP